MVVHLLLDGNLRLSAFVVLANLLLLALHHLQLGNVELLGRSNHKTLEPHAGLQVRNTDASRSVMHVHHCTNLLCAYGNLVGLFLCLLLDEAHHLGDLLPNLRGGAHDT